MQEVHSIPQDEFDEKMKASQPKRSYKAIVEKMADGPIQLDCDDRADALAAQASLHAVYQRYVSTGVKLRTRTEDNVVFASLFVLK
ncbi:MAG TPA: hypothetical protein ENI27_07665 [bacterium]|nr:hypothetical protein [bacterium]